LYLVESALALLNPARETGAMQDSVPPATMQSASPYLMRRNASPMACAPEAHAVEAAWFGPRRP
jgi:hypothetical protein